MKNTSDNRFQNTLKDLAECDAALYKLIYIAGSDVVSPDELSAAKELVKRCIKIVNYVHFAIGEFDPSDVERESEFLLDCSNGKGMLKPLKEQSVVNSLSARQQAL